jgi:hypothetical protein
MRRALAVSALALSLGLAPSAHASAPQPVRFWTNVAATIAGPGIAPPSLAVRPKAIVLFNDGSWYVEHLRWKGWGTKVAVATGTSNASNGIPDQAHGKRIKLPASVTLSDPGRFRGHEVYRCFQLTVPKHPDSNMTQCLTHVGRTWYFGAPQVKETEFLATSIGGGCSMDAARVICESYANPAQLATLKPDGAVTICSGTSVSCQQGNFGEGTPTYAAGRTVTAGPFTCEVLDTGVRCTVAATGHGFLMSKGSTVRV